jgi:hypothetical protein
MTSPVIYAAAYLLLTAPAPAHDVVRPVVQPIKLLDCPAPNHLTIRWIGDRRHHRHRHDARGHHPR